MARIQTLAPHVADLIAAGEVVERPASVAKELLENAIDAGAGAVTIEIQHGGMTLLRVTDDGCGIPPEEVETAFLRHATSKIRLEEDLEAIHTLGFRGEALAAIAAVSRVSILTRSAQAPLGAALSLEGGVVTEREEAGCPTGTTLVVRDLFYNTPARLKFVKKDAAEGAAVFAVVQRLALSHPEVSIKFIRDGKQELLTPGDGVLRSAVYSVLGREIALGLIPVQGSWEELQVTGFTSLPVCCRGSRGIQHFFVNGRHIRSRTLTAALEEAYKNQKLVGKFPACVLHLSVKHASVDVNVHPTKQEVKFSRERQTFDAVYYSVKAALESAGKRTAMQIPPQTVPNPPPAPSADLLPPIQPQLRLELDQMETPSHRPGGGLTLHDITASRGASSPIPSESVRLPTRQTAEKPPSPPMPPPALERLNPPSVQPPVDASKPNIPNPSEEMPPWRMIGEIFQTYILVEQGDKLLLIDKHAAHERIQFDALKAQTYTPMRQTLLTPVVFTPPAEEGEALFAHLSLLEEFGFDVGDFGDGALAVRQAPDYISAGEIESTLTELAAALLSHHRMDPEGVRDELLHSMACKAAIKGRQKNSLEELRRVVQAVVSGAVKYCPHGRPVAIELTRQQLEKQFKRS